MSDSLEASAYGYAAIEERKRNRATARLTDLQLRILTEQWQPAAEELIALRGRVAELEAALKDVQTLAERRGSYEQTGSIARAALKDSQ